MVRRIQQRVTAVSIVAALIVTVCVPKVTCVVDLFPFGPGEGDLTLPKGEDAAVMVTLTGAPFRMYEKDHTQISVGS